MIITGLALLAVVVVTVMVAIRTSDAFDEATEEQRFAREEIVVELSLATFEVSEWEEMAPLVEQLAELYEVRIVIADIDGRRFVDTGDGRLPPLEGVIDPFFAGDQYSSEGDFEYGADFDGEGSILVYIDCLDRAGIDYEIDIDDFVYVDEEDSAVDEACLEEAAAELDGESVAFEEPALLFIGFWTSPAIPWAQIAIVAGLVIAAAAAIAAALSRRLTEPLRELTTAAGRIRRGDLDVRVETVSTTEVADLADSFNEMAGELGRADERRRQLTADVAHELRSPLTNIIGHLDAIADGLVESTPEQIGILTSETLRLARLVDDLQTIASLDEDTMTLHTTSSDLCDLVDSAVSARAGKAAHDRVQIASSGNCSTPVLLDPDRFDQIIGNLLDNSIEHTPSGGTVTVTVSESSAQTKIVVADTGPGIPPDLLPFVFDRLSRADQSRTPGRGGRGLGLTIARGLARAHGGEITASNGARGGAIFEVTLPHGGA